MQLEWLACEISRQVGSTDLRYLSSTGLKRVLQLDWGRGYAAHELLDRFFAEVMQVTVHHMEKPVTTR